jgi:hypothetical protein
MWREWRWGEGSEADREAAADFAASDCTGAVTRQRCDQGDAGETSRARQVPGGGSWGFAPDEFGPRNDFDQDEAADFALRAAGRFFFTVVDCSEFRFRRRAIGRGLHGIRAG